MDLSSIPLFKAMKGRMAWLSERQQVLAQNVANADTPSYRAHDLKPVSFRELVGGGAGHVPLATTQVNHLAAAGAATPFRPEVDRNAELSPSGNGVSIEEQMLKVAGTANDFQLTTSLYRSHVAMLKLVLGRTA